MPDQANDNSALARIFADEQGLRYVEEQGLVEKSSLSQKLDGYTMSLQCVYADGNRIVAGITLDGYKGDYVPRYRVNLTDDAGNFYHQMGGSGSADENNTDAYVFYFDGSAIPRGASLLNLHMQILVMESTQRHGMPRESLKQGGTYGGVSSRGGSNDELLYYDESMMRKVAGIFSFDFSVHPYSARIAEIGETQAVENDGSTLTLDRVIASPSETRVITHAFQPGARAKTFWLLLNPVLQVGSGVSDRELGSRTQDDFSGSAWGGTNGGEMINSYHSSVYDIEGEWTLIVPALSKQTWLYQNDEQSGTPQLDAKTIPGPWIFRFTVPPGRV